MVRKQQQRRLAYDTRNNQIDKNELSQEICARFVSLDEYRDAETVMWYVHCRSEVRTIPTLREQLKTDKKHVVPYCTVDADGANCLGLWRLAAIDELRPGTWGILEPPQERWHEPDKAVNYTEPDIILVPGVAFDRSGGRLGNGAGYYDRLLEKVRADTILVGACYESQLFEQVVIEEHDIYMDRIITEQSVYCGKGRVCSRSY